MNRKLVESHCLRSAVNKCGLILRCERVVDRFQKTVVWADQNDVETVVLQSIEGTATEDFPSSPPIQQLHTQDINGAPVMLGVGMAGRGHWSASISLQDENGTSLLFQYAANVRGEPGWLGCSWSLANGMSAKRNDQTSELVLSGSQLAAVAFTIRPHMPVGCGTDFKHADKINGIVLQPNLNSKSVRPVCWDYEIRVVNGR